MFAYYIGFMDNTNTGNKQMTKYAHFKIYRDGYKWLCDLTLDGVEHKTFAYGFRTKRALKQHIEAASSMAKVKPFMVRASWMDTK